MRTARFSMFHWYSYSYTVYNLFISLFIYRKEDVFLRTFALIRKEMFDYISGVGRGSDNGVNKQVLRNFILILIDLADIALNFITKAMMLRFFVDISTTIKVKVY